MPDSAGAATDRKDFFISYNRADERWAVWIAWQLENAGFSTFIMAWDIGVGDHFMNKMKEEIQNTNRLVGVLSPNALASEYVLAEWLAVLAGDPLNKSKRLVLVRIAECIIPDFLQAIVYLDLFNVAERQAREELLAGIKTERRKPTAAPWYPGSQKPPESAPQFPGALPPIWNVPPRNRNFTGRVELIKRLKESLKPGQHTALTAINGMGGVGKTQLAIEYAYRHSAEYNAVWWIKSEDTTTLASDFAGLAGELGFDVEGVADQPAIVKAVKQWLEQNIGWLLIFDNVVKPEDVRPYLPRGRTGHTIITSPYTVWSGVAKPLEIEVMEPGEAVEFLLKQTGSDDEDSAKQLAKELGYLPLALEQAGAKKNYERALEIFIEFLGEDHPHTQVVREHLAMVEREMGS